MFIGLLANFFDPVQQLSQFYQTFLAGTAALDKIFDVLDTPAAHGRRAGRRRRCRRSSGQVALRRRPLRATAEDAAEVLHGVSFTVEPGQTVALVGHTGAGKSTLVKLLARFYDPTGGRITDRRPRPARRDACDSLRSQLGIVPQEGFLFSGTVRDNIAFGRPDASLEDVVAAAEAVGADEFIEALPGRLRDRRSRSAARGSRSASASWSRSRARCWPTRGC